ncbi:MAG: tyrosine-type recombinase/integrase [Acidimicrobiales bacterium]
MSSPEGGARPIRRLPATVRLDGWLACLQEALLPEGAWRPDEFDRQIWLFTGDPENPMTTSTRCRTLACPTSVASRSLCGACRAALAESGLDEEDFARTYEPDLTCQPLTGVRCVVTRDGIRCQRRSISRRSGLCQTHASGWIKSRDASGLALVEWAATAARPLPDRPRCAVAGCHNDARPSEPVCAGHFRAWRTAQSRSPAGVGSSAEWAAGHKLALAAHQFSLGGLGPVLRAELLYALQQRDRQGQRLDPRAVRGLVGAVSGTETLVGVSGGELVATLPAVANCRTYARWVCRVIGLKFEAFTGVVHTDKDVWDCLALDLEIPRPGRRPNLSMIDFTPIAQPWLRAAVKEWVATARPETWHVKRTVQAATLASDALGAGAGGGHDQRVLRFADLDAAFRAINTATNLDGGLYDTRYRRGLWASFHAVIDLGRATGLLADLPGTFSRHSSHSVAHEEANEDFIGKAVPETVIAQLDAHLCGLGADSNYGGIWSAQDTNAMFAAAYQILRDTGRRPGEVVSLRVGCVERDGDNYCLVYDNHKGRRLRRRLPITARTASIIEGWMSRRALIDLPDCAGDWLFPAAWESSGRGHLTTIRLSRALRAWVDALPELHAAHPGPDGAPAPVDRSTIYAYAFRHSYAQRHADAGVGVEVLQQLMDHRSMTVTQGYYTVSLRRKREAIKIMSAYVADRHGAGAPGPATPGAYELRSVAVPFGNCIEPANVRAGGQACPIRFQCAGCGFYRPDPSYLVAIEDHIRALRVDRETAMAMDADDFVVRNLADQADAYRQIATAMRDQLASLPGAERAEVEAASATLRRMRAGASVAVTLTAKGAR